MTDQPMLNEATSTVYVYPRHTVRVGPEWTEALPTEPGFYWYWHNTDEPEIIEIVDGGWYQCFGDEMSCKLTEDMGWFWPVPITAPPHGNLVQEGNEFVKAVIG